MGCFYALFHITFIHIHPATYSKLHIISKYKKGSEHVLNKDESKSATYLTMVLKIVIQISSELC